MDLVLITVNDVTFLIISNNTKHVQLLQYLICTCNNKFNNYTCESDDPEPVTMEDTSSTEPATTCRSSVVVNTASITTVDDIVSTESSEYSLEDTSFSTLLSTTSSSTPLPTSLPMSSTTVTVTQSSPSSQPSFFTTKKHSQEQV